MTRIMKWMAKGTTSLMDMNMLSGQEEPSQRSEGDVLRSRKGGSGPANDEGGGGEPTARNDAPLIIRLKEPAGSAMRRDVRLRVDYFSGTAAARAKRVVSRLFLTSAGRSLSAVDKALLESQLGDWLARNASALLTGNTMPQGVADDTSEVLFVFQQSDPCETDTEAPPPRPLPEAEPEAPSVVERSVVPRRPRHSR